MVKGKTEGEGKASERKYICPYCKKQMIPEMEDDRCDTGKGIMGSIGYWCSECEKDITEEIETLKNIEIEKKLGLFNNNKGEEK